MNELVILCVEDEAEVRRVLLRDIEPFATIATIEEAEDAGEAREVVSATIQAGRHLALVLCDHLLPGELGVDFLVSLRENARTAPARKVLVTGQAGLEDTVKAVNEADLDYYISKPWKREHVQDVVREQLSTFVIENVDDPLPYVAQLDGPRLMEAIRSRGNRTE